MLAAAILLAAAAVPVSTDPAIDADLRCLAVVSFAVSSATPQQRAGLIAGTMYYVGRIDAARPGYDYRAGMTALLTDPVRIRSIPDDAPRCMAVIRERGGELQRVGEALKALARDQSVEGK